MIQLRHLFFLLLTLPFLSNAQDSLTTDLSGNVQADMRYFSKEGTNNRQELLYLSASFQPEYLMEWEDGKYSIKTVLFGRLDQYDKNRTHADVRELYFQAVLGNWEYSLGAKKIFWGKTESSHLVDIINQTDAVESFDGEQKLGQPMVHVSHLANFGTLDFFVMPYFRKSQFAGKKGRLRFSDADNSLDNDFLIRGNDVSIESNLGRWNPDIAFRYSHYIGVLDFGFSYFYGTGREFLPRGGSLDFGQAVPLLLSSDDNFDDLLVFPTIHQIGIDLQATTGAMLWKAESIYRYNKAQDFIAFAGGGEFTFYDIKGADLGLIAEFLYDSREELAFSGQDNDIFLGTRFAFNDRQSTELLAGTILDVEKSTNIWSVEGSRRIGNNWKLELEGRFFFIDEKKETLINFLDQDSFSKVSLAYYF